MPLHIDYRPQNLDEVFGNDAIKTSLKSVLAREDRPHAYLFTGGSGMGKTTFGRIIKDMLGCSESDYYEFNTANSRGIDTVREISQNVVYAPLEGSCKVFLLDECHQFTGPAANALLKVLEDTPKHVYFILCTTDPDKLIKTIITRCSTYQVQALKDKEMSALIDWVLECEEKKISKEVQKEIVRVAEGCARQALVILDQVVDITDEKEALASIAAVSVGEAEVVDICRALIGKESWNNVREKVKLVLAKTEPEKLRYAILGYFSAVLLNSKQNDRASEIIDLFSENTYSTGKAGVVNMIYLATK